MFPPSGTQNVPAASGSLFVPGSPIMWAALSTGPAPQPPENICMEDGTWVVRGKEVGICSGSPEMHKGTHDLGGQAGQEGGLVPCSEAIWADWGAALQHQTPDSYPLCGLHCAPNLLRS